MKLTRRDFLKLTSAGTATAILTGCGPAARYVTRRPYADMPEYNQTGVSTYYATTCRECPAGCGLLVRTMEGRAIGVAGNPDHPVNRGKLCSRGLTTLQGLYNPDRITGPQMKGQPITWDEGVTAIQKALSQTNPKEVAFLLGLSPDHLTDLVDDLTASLGAPKAIRFGALGLFDATATLSQASREVFGSDRIPFFDLAQATVVVSFGANFLETWLSPVAYSRGYGGLRGGRQGVRGYLISFEPRMSLTSGVADEWYPLVPGTEALAALAIGKFVAELSGLPGTAPEFTDVDVADAAAQTGISEEKLRHVAEMLVKAQSPLVVVGGGALTHANGLAAGKAALAIDSYLLRNNIPVPVYSSPARPLANTSTDVLELIGRMKAGKVKTLFIHGCNPLFELPASFGFEDALRQVPLVISFASFPDETSKIATYVLPDHFSLEGWGYQQHLAGADRTTLSGSQPVVVPLYDTRATADVLLGAVQAIGGELASRLPFTDEVAYIQSQLEGYLNAGGFYSATEILSFWAQFLQYGGWWKTDAIPTPVRTPMGSRITVKTPENRGEKLHLVTFPTQMGDGSGANRPWLQETADPMTTATWNTWVEIHPETAAELGIKDDDIVLVESEYGSLEAIAYLYPAIRKDTIGIPFGQGHLALGRWAEGRGANPAKVWQPKFNENGDLAVGDTLVTIRPTGKHKQLARLESREGVYGEH